MRSIIILSCMVFVLQVSAIVINIPDDQPTIQAGIDASVDADTVLVQPGTYFENINYNGKNITVASLFFTTQDTTYISQTIIDGNQSGSVIIFENEEDSTTVLTGFTIKNGNALQNSNHFGGGIYCNYSNPRIMNVDITNNNADVGGGIFCTNSTMFLNNISITNNSSVKGGGIYCRSSNIRLINATINGNTALGGDQAVGGGIYCWDNSPIFINVIISENYSERLGGGIYLNHSSPNITNATIIDNIADLGGGIYCFFSSPNLKNVLIAGNSSFLAGGIYCFTSNPNLINATIVGNNAESAGGALYCYYNSNPSLINCILWNDLPQEIYCWDDLNTISVSNSDIQGGEASIVTNYSTVNWAEGNIDEDPLFLLSGDDPYQLTELSPCIDAGTPDTTGLFLPPWDLLHNYRVWDGDDNGIAIIDMGCYEFGADQYVNVNEPIIPNPSSLISNLTNYPNPFNPTTTISFSIPEESKVELSIYNIKGQKIKTLAHTEFNKGSHSIIWNGEDDSNKQVSSGIYMYKLNVNGKIEVVNKCLLLK